MDELRLETTADGIRLPVQGQPKARKNGLAGIHNGRLKVSVTQAPEKGKANAAILEVLAQELGLKKSQLELVAGETSTQKVVLVTGMDEAALREAIEKRLCR